MQEPDPILHQQVRMRIMAMLHRHRDLAVTEIRDHLGLTDGNLATHARKLEDAGYVEQRRALGPDGFQSRIRLTATGARAFAEYLNLLREFVEATDPSEQAPE